MLNPWIFTLQIRVIYGTYMSSLLLSWRVASIHSQRANLRLSVLLRLEVAESGQGLHLSRFSWPLLRSVRYTYPDFVIVCCICVPGTGFVRTSDRFCLPGTCTTLRWFSATLSCSHKYRVWIWRALPSPTRLAVPFAAFESDSMVTVALIP